MLTVGSLFSGIGGLDLGLERAGMKVVWQVENDPYAQKVLKKHWPDVDLYDDVRTAHGHGADCDSRCWYDESCLSPVDLICGGFPCQDLSVAGKGAGLDGERSGLWREFARIIDEVRPTWVLIENVPALRSRGLGTVLRDLSALGFDAEWDCFRASDFDAPHKRERVFVVAYAERLPVRVEQRWRGWESGKRTPKPGFDGDTRDLAQGRSVFWESIRDAHRGTWSTEPDVGRVAHGVSARVDRLRCLGNAVVPQVAEHVGRMIVAAHEGLSP